MKRTIALLLALMMIFALCACGNNDTPKGNDGDTAEYNKIELKYSINGTSTSIEAQVANLFK